MYGTQVLSQNRHAERQLLQARTNARGQRLCDKNLETAGEKESEFFVVETSVVRDVLRDPLTIRNYLIMEVSCIVH